MAAKKGKVKGGAGGIYGALRVLLEELEGEQAVKRKGPGRPSKVRGETAAVILHLYKSHIQWLDAYGEMLAGAGPENAKLSRVEVVRGLLLGLGQFALETELPLPEGVVIRSERDLQHAVARALHEARAGR